MSVCRNCGQRKDAEVRVCPFCGFDQWGRFWGPQARPQTRCPRCRSTLNLIEEEFYIECPICSLTFDKRFFGKIPDSSILAREELMELLQTSKELSYEDSVKLIHYCQYYQEELNSTNDLEILFDMQTLIARLLKQGDYQDSYWIQAHSYLLQGQLALLEMNMGEARRSISKAQEIAEDHGLQLLALKISGEHDKILRELDKWRSFKQQEAPVSERLKLVSLNETIDSMQKKRRIKPIDLTNEEPVLLLIMSGGVLLFSFPFTEEWKFDDVLFGSFLTAFSSISDEIFAEGLDRVKFGQNTVLMESVGDFSVCYLFKGQTYQAKEKLSRFAEEIQNNPSIWQRLKRYHRTSQVLETKDSIALLNLINDLFLN